MNVTQLQVTLGIFGEAVMEKDWYTVKEFAKKLDAGVDLVYQGLRSGKIKSYDRLTKQAIYRIPKSELDRFKGESQNISYQRETSSLIQKSHINRAQEEHLLELRKLIEEWNSHIKPFIGFYLDKPRWYDFLDKCRAFSENDFVWLYNTFFNYDGIKPIVYCLKEHLPYEDLWENFESFYEKYNKHFEYYLELKEDIGRRVDTWGIQTEEDFFMPIVAEISQLQMTENPKDTHIDGEWQSKGTLLILDYGVSYFKILRSENPLDFVDKYKSMSEFYLSGEIVTNLVDLYKQIERHCEVVSNTLQDILIRRDYVLHTCRLCPGQSRVTE